MNIKESISWGKDFLAKNNVEGHESSALMLLGFVLGKSREYIISNPDYLIDDKTSLKYRECIKRRSVHEPVWYITGKIDFFGQEFTVNENVLIPRPETELLIEKIIEKIRGGFSPKRIIDIGTGSGAIILSLANNLVNSKINNPVISAQAEIQGHGYEIDSRLRRNDKRDGAVKYFASDISKSALGVAKSNANNLGLDGTVEFRQGSLFEPWDGEKFDLIVANLPYVPDADELAPDLVDYEPHLALFGGEDGLNVVRELVLELPKHLSDEGKVFLEIGYDQGEKVRQMVGESLPSAKVEIIGDYANVDRIVVIET